MARSIDSALRLLVMGGLAAALAVPVACSSDSRPAGSSSDAANTGSEDSSSEPLRDEPSASDSTAHPAETVPEVDDGSGISDSATSPLEAAPETKWADEPGVSDSAVSLRDLARETRQADEPSISDSVALSREVSPEAGEVDSSMDPDSSGLTPTLVPRQGALLGLYYGDASTTAVDGAIGRKPAIHLVYYGWNDDWPQAVRSDLAEGRIPLVNWEPYDVALDDIIGGKYDSMLQGRAAAARNLGKSLFVDWGAEMNGDWSPWGGAQNGKGPAKYVAAYRHINDIFDAQGATNVVWAWCPNTTDVPAESWNEAMGYYPGDSYVDWVCVDGYNWGTTNGEIWQTFREVFAAIYSNLVQKNKPILIGEMASAEQGGDKAAWIDGIVPTLQKNYPMIRALVWFDINKETDWRIDSSPGSLAAFKRLATNAYMNP